jgi:hypothetical protein
LTDKRAWLQGNLEVDLGKVECDTNIKNKKNGKKIFIRKLLPNLAIQTPSENL